MAEKSSPLKSISVRDDGEGKRAMHIKQKEKKYVSIANFHFQLLYFVEFPARFTKYNGYVLDVHRRDGISMWV